MDTLKRDLLRCRCDSFLAPTGGVLGVGHKVTEGEVRPPVVDLSADLLWVLAAVAAAPEEVTAEGVYHRPY